MISIEHMLRTHHSHSTGYEPGITLLITIPLTELDDTLPINSLHNEDQAKALSVAFRGGHKNHVVVIEEVIIEIATKHHTAVYEHQATLYEHQAAPYERQAALYE